MGRAPSTASSPVRPPRSTPASRRGERGSAFVNVARATLVALLLMELGSRLAGFGGRVRFDSSMDMLWAPHPNQVTGNNFTGRRVTIDADGLRAVPGAGQASGHRLQVLCLGNSVTFGYALADSETYEAVLQRRLEERDPGRWRLRNCGVNGYNLFLVRRRLEALLAGGIRPDVILVGFCFNEQPEWPGEHFSPGESSRIVRGVRLKNALRRSGLYNFLVERVAGQRFYQWRNKLMPGRRAAPGAAGAARAGATRDTAGADRWLEDHYRPRARATLEEMRGLGVPVLALLWPDPKRRMLAYRSVFGQECDRAGVPCLDLQSLVEGRTPPVPYFDALHPEAPAVRLLVDGGILPFFLRETARKDSAAAIP